MLKLLSLFVKIDEKLMFLKLLKLLELFVKIVETFRLSDTTYIIMLKSLKLSTFFVEIDEIVGTF